MLEIMQSSDIDPVKLMESILSHPDFKKAADHDGSVFKNKAQDRMAYIDFTHSATGHLRMIFRLKGRELDRAFRAVEDVFEGWDGHYSVDLPLSGNTAHLERIRDGVGRMFAELLDIGTEGVAYRFALIGTNRLYEFG